MSENNNNVNDVKLVPGICTQCGGQLQVDPNQEAAVCPFCGTPYIVSKAINNYNTIHVHQNVQNNIRIQHGKRGVFESAAELIDRQLEREQNAAIRQQEIALEREKLNLIREQRKKEKTSKFWKYVGYFFGWIYCFPIPLMLVLKKRDDIDPIKKKKYIIAAWAVYALFLVFAATNSKSTDASTSTQRQTSSQVVSADSVQMNESAVLKAGSYSVTLPEGYVIGENDIASIADGNGKAVAAVQFKEVDVKLSDFQRVESNPSQLNSSLEKSYDEVLSVDSKTVEKNGMHQIKYYINGITHGDTDIESNDYYAFMSDGSKVYMVQMLSIPSGIDRSREFEAIVDSLK